MLAWPLGCRSAESVKNSADVLQGVFAIDLTLEEIRSLRALQPRPYREQRHNGMYSIPTLQEYIRLAQSYSRAVGIYPETKHAMWHDSQGLSCMQGSNMTAMLLQVRVKAWQKMHSAAAEALLVRIRSLADVDSVCNAGSPIAS